MDDKSMLKHLGAIIEDDPRNSADDFQAIDRALRSTDENLVFRGLFLYTCQIVY